MNATADLIQKTTLLKRAFNNLTPEELEELANLTEIKTYPAGCVLCREGAYEDTFYILVDGQAAITMTVSENGEQRLLRIAQPGDYFGEMALIQNTTRAASIVTTTPATALEMSRANFERALRLSPKLAFHIMQAIIDRLRANDQGIISELRHVNETLKKLDRNKTEFIEVAAHELRTPLTVMSGYARMLSMDAGLRENAMLQEVVKGILKGTDRLLEVVNGMLDVSRLTGGTVTLNPAPVLVRSVIRQLIDNLKADLAARKLTVHTEFTDDVPIIQADPKLVEKALNHLIHNAIKYTPDGRDIFVTVGPGHLDDGNPALLITVRDTGIGIAPDQQDLIFEKFYQVGEAALHSSGTTTFKGGGPGMGLAIVKGVAEAHGGRVWVESPGHDETTLPGSTFYLLLPALPPSPTSASPNTIKLDRPLFSKDG